ncbi:MAG: hypothetical protein ACR2GR_01120, partial [Rhodothermales bacterium]
MAYFSLWINLDFHRQQRNPSWAVASFLSLCSRSSSAPAVRAQTGADATLLAAAQAGDATDVQATLQAGADPDAADADGATALLWTTHDTLTDRVRV